jgi:hypothetical protein
MGMAKAGTAAKTRAAARTIARVERRESRIDMKVSPGEESRVGINVDIERL